MKLEADGKLMSGRDVAIACALGAEEFGFATAPLVALGCIMLRACNLDTCTMGIATQNPAMRKHFQGKPEYVVNFMTFLARQLREILASLGLRSVEELVGRTDLLCPRPQQSDSPGSKLDISAMLTPPQRTGGFRAQDVYDFQLEHTLDETVLLGLLAGRSSLSSPFPAPAAPSAPSWGPRSPVVSATRWRRIPIGSAAAAGPGSPSVPLHPAA